MSLQHREMSQCVSVSKTVELIAIINYTQALEAGIDQQNVCHANKKTCI